MFKKEDYTVLFHIGLALIGVMGLLFATTWGIGITPDSPTYIGAARNLLNGRGLSMLSAAGKLIPMTHYAPLYPILLAMIGVFGIDPLNGARCLNAFLFGANILLVGLMINRYTRSFWTSLFGSFLMLGSIDMLSIHSVAMTEPVFIFFGILGLFLLACYIENLKPLFLIASSGAIALAFLGRYPGVTFVMTGIVGIFFLSRKTYHRRLWDSIICLVLGSLPMALWIIRNFNVAGRPTGRKMAFHPINFAHVETALSTLSTWLLPLIAPAVIRGILLLIASAGLLILSILLLQRRRRLDKSASTKQHLASIPSLLLTFIFIYGVFLIVSISFFDAHTPLDKRMLSPIFVSGIVLILSVGYELFHSVEGVRTVKVVGVVICIVFAGSYLLRGTVWVIHSHSDGIGYASKAWKQSEIIQKVRAIPSAIRVYTNGPDAIYILTGKTACMIPVKVDPNTRMINDDYLPQLTVMGEQLKNQSAVLVWFDRITWRWYLPSEGELAEALPLNLIERGTDGAIYEGKE